MPTTRRLIANLAVAFVGLSAIACGCTSDTNSVEDEKMTARREAPAETRTAPGGQAGMDSSSQAPAGETPPTGDGG